jgi:hypothetical protein
MLILMTAGPLGGRVTKRTGVRTKPLVLPDLVSPSPAAGAAAATTPASTGRRKPGRSEGELHARGPRGVGLCPGGGHDQLSSRCTHRQAQARWTRAKGKARGGRGGGGEREGEHKQAQGQGPGIVQS